MTDSLKKTPGRLFVVATPIGNLDDISARALQSLSGADLVAAEDTRRTRRLLSHFGLKKPLLALHDHNEAEAAGALIERLEAGETIALVSDAGTPLISDPGFRLVNAAISANLEVVPIPGASALLCALSIAGLPCESFVYLGFLPKSKDRLDSALTSLQFESRSTVIFESVHRLGATLKSLGNALGDSRRAVVCRELTKQFESVYRGTLGSLQEDLLAGTIVSKGEFVIVLGGAQAEPAAERPLTSILEPLLAELPMKQAVRLTAQISGTARNEVYALALSLKDQNSPN